MTEEQIRAKIAELERQLKTLIEQANLQAASIGGGIEALKSLLPKAGEDDEEK